MKSSSESYVSSMDLPELGKNSSESINMLMVPHINPSNPFAFSLEQMCHVVDQKHLDFLEKVGGIEGIAKGLHSNTKGGIIWNEENLSYIRMFDLVQSKTEEEVCDTQFPISMECDTFIQRRHIFGSNVLPVIEEVSLLELMWQSFQDKTLVKTKLSNVCLFFFFKKNYCCVRSY